MESELTTIHSSILDRQAFIKQLDIIKQASELAQSKIDYNSAHDDNIIRAIDVVEDFLRKTHRLCYGGQAINAHLPAKYKFYDPEFSIPDYDFFTPNHKTDIASLVKDLKKAGFTEISVREGMHDGTIKIYVDYIPIADMTLIDSKLYRILSKREYRTEGISYLDANSLRMLMYLELSRPRGEVSRWPKVYERLLLLNEFVPVRHCKVGRRIFNGGLRIEQVEYTIAFIIENKRVFAGADLLEFYSSMRAQGIEWVISSRKPIIFFSPDVDADSKILREEFNFLSKSDKKSIAIKSYSSRGTEILPFMKIITYGKKALVFIIEQTACNSYINIPTADNKILRIATIDTLISLYFGLGLFDSKFYTIGSMECLANNLVKLITEARTSATFPFPFISIRCAGHQTSLPSLIRAKVKRITQKKHELKNILDNNKHNTRNTRNTRNTIRNRYAAK